MLQKLQSLFQTKPVPAPIAQPTIQTRASKAVQECFTKIRASIACLCCVKPMQKKVVVQQSKINQVAQSALQIASEHKKKTIAAAVVGAASGIAYVNYQNPCALQKIFDQIRSCFSEQTPVSNPIPTYLPLITGTGCVAAIVLISYLSYKKTNTIAPNDLEETSTKISKKEDVRIALIPSIISAAPLLAVLRKENKYSHLKTTIDKLILDEKNIHVPSCVSVFNKMDISDVATVLNRMDENEAYTVLSKMSPKAAAAALLKMRKNLAEELIKREKNDKIVDLEIDEAATALNNRGIEEGVNLLERMTQADAVTLLNKIDISIAANLLEYMSNKNNNQSRSTAKILAKLIDQSQISQFPALVMLARSK